MKKLLPILLFCFSTIAYAQENTLPQDTNKKHELKLNVLGLLTSEWIDVSYEYLVNEESSFGVALQFGLDDENQIADTYRTFSITPYYRRYFSNKYARGFYVEGFGMLHSFKDSYFSFDSPNPGGIEVNEKRTNFALGISVGGKFISKGGFTTDIYLGLGRNLGNNDFDYEVVGRVGISLGYRF
ncbi:MAG: DUF3575 domain-containing protein [Flavobacteriaceae bacterium]|nr:DUF3575 domain-containing protein [Flavobacteriaceae bacterium]